MAESLTRSRGWRGRTSDRHERELKRLRLSVCDDTGFRLYLATYDQPTRRDQLIQRVIREAEAEKVRVTRLDLSAAGLETNLVGLLRAHVQETDLRPGWRQAVMVTGIEQRLDYSAGPKGFAFLHQANLLRDALPEAAPVPVVLWLSRLASAALPAEAPDLWHWRAANFDFTGDKAPRIELLRELTSLQDEDEDEDGLSREQQEARVHLLEDLLAELKREGPPRTKRQKAERANLLLELGIASGSMGRENEAVPCFEQALEIFLQISDRRGEGYAFCGLGLAYDRLSEPRRAIEHSEQSLKIMREIGDRRGECAVLANLGLAYATVGETRKAIEHYEQSLKIERELGDKLGESKTLGILGNAYLRFGDPRQAIEFYEEQLAIARELGDRRGEGQALARLGNAYAELGEVLRAIEPYAQHLLIAREIGDRRGEGNALSNLGDAYAKLGDLRWAIEQYEEALTITREIGNREGEYQALASLGVAYGMLGETRPAIEHLEQSLAIASDIGDRRGQGNSLYNSALAFDQLGERGEAVTRMEDALRIYEQIEDLHAARARAKLAEWRGEGGG